MICEVDEVCFICKSAYSEYKASLRSGLRCYLLSKRTQLARDLTTRRMCKHLFTGLLEGVVVLKTTRT